MMNRDATGQKLPFFVYGTLMIGQPNDYLWHGCLKARDAAVFDEGRLVDYGHYPVLLPADGESVLGQLIRVVNGRYAATLQRVDELEGFDPQRPNHSLFRRVRRTIRTRRGTRHAAWVYIGQGSTLKSLPVVPGGDWTTHSAGNKRALPNTGQDPSAP
jgi:gamma-glutamylcyclotransferase (GGCT)/AIG2-like uncharacterized protein YtfP